MVLIIVAISCRTSQQRIAFYSLSFPRIYRSEECLKDSTSNKNIHEYLLFQNDTSVCRFYSDQKTSFIKSNYQDLCVSGAKAICKPIAYDGLSFVLYSDSVEDRYLINHKIDYLWVDIDRVNANGEIILFKSDLLFKIIKL